MALETGNPFCVKNYFFSADIDNFMNHICSLIGGSCMDGVNNYSCACLFGFTGDFCETS